MKALLEPHSRHTCRVGLVEKKVRLLIVVEFVLDGDDDFFTNQGPQSYSIELKAK